MSFVDDFAKAICPESPELLLMTNEENILKTATKLILDQRKALQEIAKGEGAFSRDPLDHACNCIDNMKQIATEALK